MLPTRTIAKRIFALLALLVPIVLALYATNYPLKKELEDRIVAELTAQGMTEVKVAIAGLNQQHIVFSGIAFTKEKMKVEVEGLSIAATNLPYKELLQSNYTNVTANWSVKSIAVTGIPYALPPLSGAGSYYMKDKKPVITGEMHDEKRTHQADFTVTSTTALLENIQVLWQKSTLSAKEVVIHLTEKKPIYIPLQVKSLPLDILLAVIPDGKASGDGMVSGAIDVLVRPDGSFTLSQGRLGAGKSGVVRIAPDAIPGGDQPQLEMARQALSDFHYTDLTLTLSPDKQDKVMVHLQLVGNNPQAFDGRTIKLNVNLSGDVLELVQQSILPMANPTDWIEKETP